MRRTGPQKLQANQRIGEMCRDSDRCRAGTGSPPAHASRAVAPVSPPWRSTGGEHREPTRRRREWARSADAHRRRAPFPRRLRRSSQTALSSRYRSRHRPRRAHPCWRSTLTMRVAMRLATSAAHGSGSPWKSSGASSRCPSRTFTPSSASKCAAARAANTPTAEPAPLRAAPARPSWVRCPSFANPHRPWDVVLAGCRGRGGGKGAGGQKTGNWLDGRAEGRCEQTEPRSWPKQAI